MFNKKKPKTKTFVDGKEQKKAKVEEPEEVEEQEEEEVEEQEEEEVVIALPMTILIKIDEAGNLSVAKV